MPHIRIYGYLRNYVDQPGQTVPGPTVGAALDALCARSPALRPHLFGPDGLSEHILVILRGRDIDLEAGLSTPVDDHEQIGIFPPISGGRVMSDE